MRRAGADRGRPRNFRMIVDSLAPKRFVTVADWFKISLLHQAPVMYARRAVLPSF
jgi:hypothetical protein